MPKWTSAEWIDMPEEVFEFYKTNKIALKKLKNSQEISSEFLKELLNSFIRGLKVIHSKGFIHHGIHTGNLIITEIPNKSKYKFIRLGDLGLCRLTNETSSETYGIAIYCTLASDIHSVGIIMWVISTGKRPFANRAYNSELAC
ncbi:hypothetical protein Glove_199g161 [Diversispora epigaea]|uniref:Protein kinase domain-containing protein n=1 Tax=Diversispora epigaea TaxID=1348612 RepID=A0A397ITI9_9GLOM|nr:hypothetical protein Glove_199g161 [Diversispora epigaea]